MIFKKKPNVKTVERYYEREPTANLKKDETWKINLVLMGVGFVIITIVGFAVLGAVSDAKEEQANPSKEKENPYIAFLYIIPMLIIIVPKILRKKKNSTIYTVEGKLAK